MVAFNPPVLQCSKFYFPYKISTTTNIYVTTWQQASPVAWERERKKKKGRFYDFLYFVLFFPISLVCQEKTPRWCFTTVLIVVFVWVSAYFLGLKVRCSELVQREKEKKKWRYILCYINVEKFLLFFFPVFFFLPLLKVAEVSINFYWNVLGVLWNAFTPTLPKEVPGRMEGLKDIYPSSAFLLPPHPLPNIKTFLLEGASTNQSGWCRLNCWWGNTSFKQAV